MNGYYKEVVEWLRKAGYTQIPGGKGSHEKWSNGKRTITVPFNCKSRHTANKVLRDAGIKHRI